MPHEVFADFIDRRIRFRKYRLYSAVLSDVQHMRCQRKYLTKWLTLATIILRGKTNAELTRNCSQLVFSIAILFILATTILFFKCLVLQYCKAKVLETFKINVQHSIFRQKEFLLLEHSPVNGEILCLKKTAENF